MAKILIVDDDRQLSKALSRYVEKRAGHRATSCRLLEEGLEMARGENFDAIFLDVSLPDGDGLAALGKFKSTASAPEVIVMTGYATRSGAETAIRSDAWDYVTKPFEIDEALSALEQALQYRKEKQRAVARQELALDRIAGSSPGMLGAYEKIRQCAAWDGNVLLTGETGTGKELFARAIHANSLRTDKPFVALDCTVLPETLVESWLFGYEKGSFTGADIPREGLVRQAAEGTLFLDEIGELPLGVQRKFLRVLETRKLVPVGSKTEVESKFRLIAATNRDPEEMVERGTFRSDLLYRLRGTEIHLPPLRKRMEDLCALVEFHLKRIAGEKGIESLRVTSEFMECLKTYSWPGNVRELVNVLETAAARVGESGKLFHYHIPEDLRIKTVQKMIAEKRANKSSGLDEPINGDTFPTLREYRQDKVALFEKEYLVKLMRKSNNEIGKACKKSGMSKSRLYRLLKTHKISRKNKDDA